VVQLKERQIPAGGSVSIPVTLNPKGLPSDIHKRVVVRVSTGEVAEQNIVFHLTATIDRMPVVTILPSQIDLEDVVIGADSSKIATVYFNGPRGLFDSIPDSIKVTGLQHEALKVPYKATQPEPSSKAVRIEFSPGADLPRGSFNLDTRIIFVGAETYETRLMIRGTAREELVSNPGQLYLSTGVDSKETGTLLEIGSLRNRAIDPKRISSDLPIAWAVRERSASGDRLKLKVWPAADASVAGVLVGHIKVEMDNQTEPLKIPVTMVQIQSLSSGAVTRN